MKLLIAPILLLTSALSLADEFDDFAEFDELEETAEQENPVDPWEGFNRPIFEFNESLDRAVLKPVANAYLTYTPEPVSQGVSNVFRNLGEPMVIANDILQLKIRQAASDSARFVVNSLLGVLGIFDVATPLGLERHDEDFGQTLGYWGVGTGPYLVLPFFGSSNVRDGFGTAVHFYASNQTPVLDPLYSSLYPESQAAYYGALALKTIDLRASLMAAEGLVTGDRYVFLRSAYLQRRAYLVNDGSYGDPFAAEKKRSKTSDDTKSKEKDQVQDEFDLFPEFE